MPGPPPKPPAQRRRRNITADSGAWSTAPGAAETVPDPPTDLKVTGRVWWESAWKSPVSAGWTDSEVRIVERAAGLADACAQAGASSATYRELRALEDALSLTRAGRLRNRITLPAEEDPSATDSAASRRGAWDARRRRLSGDEPGDADSSVRESSVYRLKAI